MVQYDVTAKKVQNVSSADCTRTGCLGYKVTIDQRIFGYLLTILRPEIGFVAG